jgi:hypothetical protein
MTFKDPRQVWRFPASIEEPAKVQHLKEEAGARPGSNKVAFTPKPEMKFTEKLRAVTRKASYEEVPKTP